MEYIDKSKSRLWAHELIRNFLKRRFDEDGKYPDDLYAAFRADPECKMLLWKNFLRTTTIGVATA